jgi:hypothetical protein
MEDAVLGLALILSGLLLAFTTYAAIVGLFGLLGRSYELCPRCHTHYLTDRSRPEPHQCLPVASQPVHHGLRTLVHHAHAGRH